MQNLMVLPAITKYANTMLLSAALDVCCACVQGLQVNNWTLATCLVIAACLATKICSRSCFLHLNLFSYQSVVATSSRIVLILHS